MTRPKCSKRPTTITSALLVVFCFTALGAPGDLRKAVEEYWRLIGQGNLDSALEYVAQQSRNAFIKKSKPQVRSWRIDQIQPLAGGRFAVSARLEAVLPGHGLGEWTVVENWILEKGRWKVLVGASSRSWRSVWEGNGEVKTHPGVLDILPTRLRTHFISSNQTSTLLIRNGLEEEVRVLDVRLDKNRFKVDSRPSVVAAGKSEAIVVLYTGRELAKNQQSTIDIVLETAAGVRTVSVPVTYNYISRGTRALLGLTTKEAEQLTREAAVSLRPALQIEKNTETLELPSIQKPTEKKPQYRFMNR